MKDDDEGWVRALEIAPPAMEGPVQDQLEELRLRAAGIAPREEPGREKEKEAKEKVKEKAQEVSSEASSSKKKRKKKRSKRKKREKDDPAAEKKELTSGRHPVKASKKDVPELFGGTGLDPRSRERKRVLRKAQKYVTRKGNKKRSRSSRSSSSEGSSHTSPDGPDVEGVFTESKKARAVAERYPGALAWETLVAMRRSLLVATGEEQEEQSLRPTALLYYRYQVAPKVAGPQAREMVNLSSAIDCLLRGQAAQCLDILCQRLKSQESSTQGVHWAVGQQMEIPEPAVSSLAARPELEAAQKQTYAESKTKYMAQRDGGGGKKGDAKGKSKSKGDRFDSQKGDNRGKKAEGKGNEKK